MIICFGVVNLFRKHLELSALNQGTVSKIERRHRSLVHVGYIPTQRSSKIRNEYKTIKEYPISFGYQLTGKVKVSDYRSVIKY